MAINKLELQWWWCRICFGVGGGFLLDFTLHYSLRNCAIHSDLFYAIAHVCDFTRTKVLINFKKERFMVAEYYTSVFLLLVIVCAGLVFCISKLHNWECANSHAFPPLSIYFDILTTFYHVFNCEKKDYGQYLCGCGFYK